MQEHAFLAWLKLNSCHRLLSDKVIIIKMFRLCQRLAGSRHLVTRQYLNAPRVSPSLILRFNTTDTDNTTKISDAKKAQSDALKKRLSKVWWMLMISGTALLGLTKFAEEKKKARLKDRQSKQMKTFGEALIGGPFNLLTMDGKPVTDKDFLGKWLLIYFGFTHCPDVCPEMLEKIASAVDILETSNADPFVPLFVSVDPERDTPDAIMSYLNEFSPKIVGLTGTLEEVKKVCKSYRIYHSQGPKDIDNDYIVDHSIFIFLMRPDGKFADMFSPTDKVDHIVTKTKSVMADYLQVKGNELDIVDG